MAEEERKRVSISKNKTESNDGLINKEGRRRKRLGCFKYGDSSYPHIINLHSPFLRQQGECRAFTLSYVVYSHTGDTPGWQPAAGNRQLATSQAPVQHVSGHKWKQPLRGKTGTHCKAFKSDGGGWLL